MGEKDVIFSQPLEQIQNFTFDEKVAAVFPDMINRSVPGYATVIAMTGVLAGQYAQENTNCYDLGCSLGESSFAMSQQLEMGNYQIIAVDNSPQMLDQCSARLMQVGANQHVTLICDDILNIDFENASVIVMNYTLQFIAPEKRKALIARIYQSLKPGGIMLLSEKVRDADPATDQRLIDMHHAFKKANGYSELEISQKRTALEDVLLPETLQQHHERLKLAGFDQVDCWFQCFNFASLIAYKN